MANSLLLRGIGQRKTSSDYQRRLSMGALSSETFAANSKIANDPRSTSSRDPTTSRLPCLAPLSPSTGISQALSRLVFFLIVLLVIIVLM